MKIWGRMVGIFGISLCLVACGVGGGAGKSVNLTEKNIVKLDYRKTEKPNVTREAYRKFAVEIFKKTVEKEENFLLSPLSIVYALGMTANGAEGETLAEMEKVFGIKHEMLNAFLKDDMPKGEGLKAANSIWIKNVENVDVEKRFLEEVGFFYQADVFRAEFNEGTKKDINHWVKDKTEGKIEKLLDKISKEAVMYLVNALSFDRKWLNPYKDYQISNREFKDIDGKEREVEMMYSEEGTYLENEKMTGFLKPYEGGKYALVCLLPKEGKDVRECVKEFAGEELGKLLREKSEETVITGLPKFRAESEKELSKMLEELGMKTAFDMEKANFSKISKQTGFSISKVIHKSMIEVDTEGTRAAAVTGVEMVGDAAAERMKEPKKVILDRPFFYMIIDEENEIPIFMGTMLK